MARNEHPADDWQNRMFWINRKDQPEAIQIIDLLHDIRFLLLVIAAFTIFGG